MNQAISLDHPIQMTERKRFFDRSTSRGRGVRGGFRGRGYRSSSRGQKQYSLPYKYNKPDLPPALKRGRSPSDAVANQPKRPNSVQSRSHENGYGRRVRQERQRDYNNDYGHDSDYDREYPPMASEDWSRDRTGAWRSDQESVY